MKERFSNMVPDRLRELRDRQQKIINKISPVINLGSTIKDFYNSDILQYIQSIGDRIRDIENNPELQFIVITDLERLNIESTNTWNEILVTDIPDVDIEQKEKILNENLIPYLDRLNLTDLWNGAEFALQSDVEQNPDKFRHCLVSLRTLLEYLIETKLAPNELLSESPSFNSDFKKCGTDKAKIDRVKIKRKRRIEYFTNKIQFGMIGDFTVNDIDCICECYAVLCEVHNPFITLSENQVRCLKMKTGIILWFLTYIDEIIENQ